MYKANQNRTVAGHRLWSLLLGVFLGVMLAGLLVLLGTRGTGSDEGAAGPAGFAPQRSEIPASLKAHKSQPVTAPDERKLTLTIPSMSRVDDVSVTDAPAGTAASERALEKGALHVRGTGFPWKKVANVYIAGHRLGYPTTGSFLLFYDLDRLDRGEKVILTDSAGARYTYTVTDKTIVAPTDLTVTRTVPGKNVVTLQTCTLPDFSKRLVVRGALSSVKAE